MKSQEIAEIKAQLPWGSYKILSGIMKAKKEAGRINKSYTPGTIEKMFNGHRTMSEDVLATAETYLETINPQ